jgi:squalene cyclase
VLLPQEDGPLAQGFCAPLLRSNRPGHNLVGAGARPRGVNHPAVARGIAYLTAQQGADGFWTEPRYTATGFPRVFYLRYHGYAKFFPLWALARYRNLKSGNVRAVAFGM